MAPDGTAPGPPAPAPRCAAAARERGDPPVGTALAVRRWLLLEHPGPWPYDALGGIGLPTTLLHDLVGRTRASGSRTLLVRRPGRLARDAPRRWHVVDAGPDGRGRSASGPWDRDEDLRAAMEAVTAGPADPMADGVPRLLVCTHGRHDACCAIHGRPVAAALEAEWPGSAWECSHVGGDRFAANVVVLPDCTWYGGLDPATAVRVVRTHLGGVVTPELLRGFGGMPPVAQVAAVEAHRRLGPGAPGDVAGFEVAETGDHRWRVVLEGRGALPARIVVDVTGFRRPAAHLTCHAVADTRAWQWDVTDVRVG